MPTNAPSPWKPNEPKAPDPKGQRDPNPWMIRLIPVFRARSLMSCQGSRRAGWHAWDFDKVSGRK